jgi:hypothetical protein
MISSGLFTPNEFRNRGLLKLAPDAFVSINGSLGARVLSPVNVNNKKGLEVRGGLTSINVNLALSPPGASTASLDVIAPQYKGLHEDYYINLPNGTKMPYFAPMMEVKIYMKGRFLDESTGYKPQYYPVFWGFITDISETYNGGVSTFSIKCADILAWWKYQKITMNPSVFSSLYGGPTMNKFPTVFENMTPWEIIYALFLDTFFVSDQGAAYNFIYPKLSKSGFTPDFGGLKGDDLKETFTSLTMNVIKYWSQRFGFDLDTPIADPDRAPLEMFGLQGPISLESVRECVSTFRSTAREDHQSSMRARLTLDFGILSRIQPYGSFSLYGDGSSSLEKTKLEIAQEVCEQTHMEFFLDSNGRIVFKPPLYNLDVNSDSVPHYVFKPEDIIGMTSTVNSESICNYLEVTAPMRYELEELEVIGYHIDFDSIARYGLRYQSQPMRYGNDAISLRLVACAEMTRINGRAYTASLSTVLRPEMRLGYPIYIKHLDAYYYVSSISHNVSFGQSATTDLGLEFRRDRLWDDGTVTGVPGAMLKSKVFRYNQETNITIAEPPKKMNEEEFKSAQEKAQEVEENLRKALNDKVNAIDSAKVQQIVNNILKEEFKTASGVLSGPPSQGFYKISDASIKPVDSKLAELINENEKRVSDDKSSEGTSSTKDIQTTELDARAETQAVVSNELLMITDDTVPYTDRNGYRHIGAFPYGANLKVTRNSDMVDLTNPRDKTNAETDGVLSASGASTSTSSSGYLDNASEPPGTMTPVSNGSPPDPADYNRFVNEQRDLEDIDLNTPNPDNNPDLFSGVAPSTDNIVSDQALNSAVQAVNDITV